MPDTVTNAIELAVGAGCLVAGAGVWRKGGFRWLASLLAAAGPAAVEHALVSLA